MNADLSLATVKNPCPGAGRFGITKRVLYTSNTYSDPNYCRVCLRGPFTLTKKFRIPTHKSRPSSEAVPK